MQCMLFSFQFFLFIQFNVFLTLKNGYVLTITTHIYILIMIPKFYNKRSYLASSIYNKKYLPILYTFKHFLVEHTEIHFITYIMKY